MPRRIYRLVHFRHLAPERMAAWRDRNELTFVDVECRDNTSGEQIIVTLVVVAIDDDAMSFRCCVPGDFSASVVVVIPVECVIAYYF